MGKRCGPSGKVMKGGGARWWEGDERRDDGGVGEMRSEKKMRRCVLIAVRNLREDKNLIERIRR